jgi:uncharacterized protein (DUF427 family)
MKTQNYFLASYIEAHGYKTEKLYDGSVSFITKETANETVRTIVWSYKQARNAMKVVAR